MQNALVPVSAGGIRGSGLFCGYFYRIQEAHAAQIPDRKAVQPGGVTAEKLQTTGSKYTELITSPRSYGHSRRRRI